jgi:hypothetical protein
LLAKIVLLLQRKTAVSGCFPLASQEEGNKSDGLLCNDNKRGVKKNYRYCLKDFKELEINKSFLIEGEDV